MPRGGHYQCRFTPATPEEIWNILREVAESQKETDRRMQETELRLRKLDELLNGQ